MFTLEDKALLNKAIQGEVSRLLRNKKSSTPAFEVVYTQQLAEYTRLSAMISEDVNETEKLRKK